MNEFYLTLGPCNTLPVSGTKYKKAYIIIQLNYLYNCCLLNTVS